MHYEHYRREASTAADNQAIYSAYQAGRDRGALGSRPVCALDGGYEHYPRWVGGDKAARFRRVGSDRGSA